jgi:hypothetical protein
MLEYFIGCVMLSRNFKSRSIENIFRLKYFFDIVGTIFAHTHTHTHTHTHRIEKERKREFPTYIYLRAICYLLFYYLLGMLHSSFLLLNHQKIYAYG